MIKELDLVVLTRDLPEYNLMTGDIGTVVHCYKKTGYEIEFVTAEGKTVAVLTLSDKDIRPFEHSEILHTREIPSVVA
jgi:hypothetical protein